MVDAAKVEEVLKERAQFHGDAESNNAGFVNLGLVFTGILQDHYKIKLPHPIPGHIAALMLCGLKTCRAARPFKLNDDDYVDLVGYAKLAEQVVKAKGLKGNGK